MNRRNFLKLAGAFPLALALPPAVRRTLGGESRSRHNVIIVVFDAWSASNVSLYGYGRITTPNIDRIAKRAIVYRNHHAAANFTTPGTTSILTGAYPWTHGATMPWQQATQHFRDQNLFSAFDDYYRIAYTHNDLAFAVINTLSNQIQELPQVEDLFLKAPPAWLRQVFRGDKDIASVAWSRAMAVRSGTTGYSLFASSIAEMASENSELRRLRSSFPRGLPSRGDGTTAFVLESAINWLLSELAAAPQPLLTYLHLLPPHAPYNTSLEFVDAFSADGFQAVPQRFDPLAEYDTPMFHKKRQYYDEYILYVDAQFARLYEQLEGSGQLENTWLILTSDHGEIFERGFLGHRTPALYQPEIHVPLLIFEPGREVGVEVHAPTSAVDLLPTLCYLTGHAIPTETDGVVLPPFLPPESRGGRAVFSFVDRSDMGPSNWTAAGIQWPYKAMYFNGYGRLGHLRTVNRKNVKILETLGGNKLLRLFDLQNDPDELHDLAVEMPAIVGDMVPQLEAALQGFLSRK